MANLALAMKTQIRITDPDVIRLVEQEKHRRGDAKTTKTAANLIRERIVVLEQIRLGSSEPRERERAPAEPEPAHA